MPFVELTRRTTPRTFFEQNPALEFVRSKVFADGYRPVTDGAEGVSGEVMAFFRSTLAIAEGRRPELPLDEVREIIDGYIRGGTVEHLAGEELRVFLMAFTNAFENIPHFPRDAWIRLLGTVPDDCGCADELVGALSMSADSLFQSSADPALIDLYLERAFRLVVSGAASEVRPVYLALTYRLCRPKPVDFGPGKGLKGRASTLANLFTIAPLLKHPSHACLPLVYTLSNWGGFALTWEEMVQARETTGLPDIPEVKFCWAAAEACLAPAPVAQDARRDTSSAAPSGRIGAQPKSQSKPHGKGKGSAKAKGKGKGKGSSKARGAQNASPPATAVTGIDPSKARDPSGAFKALRAIESDGTLSAACSPVDDKGIAAITGSFVFGHIFRRLGPGEAEGLVRFLAPRLADGRLDPPIFVNLVGGILEDSPSLFRDALARAAADGLFGDGTVLLRIMVCAVCIPKMSVTPLDSIPEIESLRRRAGLAGATLCTRLARCLVDCEKAARTGEGLRESLKTLSGLWPETRRKAYRPGEDSGPDPEEERGMCCLAFAAALVAASWGPEGESTAGLLDVLPPVALSDQFFADVMLPGALYCALSIRPDAPGPRRLADSCLAPGSGIPGSVQLRGIEALKIVKLVGSRIPATNSEARALVARIRASLAGPLPPRHRGMLVAAGVCALSSRWLADETLGFYSENSLMLLPPLSEDSPPVVDRGGGFVQDKTLQISYPAPLSAILGADPLPPGMERCGSDAAERAITRFREWMAEGDFKASDTVGVPDGDKFVAGPDTLTRLTLLADSSLSLATTFWFVKLNLNSPALDILYADPYRTMDIDLKKGPVETLCVNLARERRKNDTQLALNVLAYYGRSTRNPSLHLRTKITCRSLLAPPQKRRR
ncbi:MAG: hypothetical protein LBT40_16670 [Deltaproteobacteria bacterium]|nr:hypothetical protein [Deltaproteobacteria bacterium]